MATAYAAFTSLMHLISDLQQHPHPPIQLDEEQVVSVNSMICFFLRFLEAHHNTIDHGMETRMADAAHTAEDLIDTHIAERVLDQSDFNGSLQRAIEGFDILKKQVEKLNQNEPIRQGNNQPSQDPLQWPTADSSDENHSVGIEDIATRIMDKLTSQYSSSLQIISITGMGGIGKTTLARKVYNHPYVQHYFDFHAWTAISKDYNAKESLVQILCCVDKTQNKQSLSNRSEHQLGEQLYKYLFGRRYLVVLDDVWDIEAWDRMKCFFPTSKGSGIVITTRESSVGSISSNNFGMDLLDEHQSWGLLCEKAFGKDSCPRALEKVGKDIARKCRGLPLSIVVIGGHLAKSPRTQGYWEYVACNLSDVVNSEDNERCLKILSLSYDHLPVHLKPCFLYTAIFPEDEVIVVPLLIRLWVAEGFLKPVDGKSLEEAAVDYLNDLISRHLILVDRLNEMGDVERCKIHDLLRDLCLKEASKKNFLCILREQWPGIQKVSNNERRIVLCQSASMVMNYFYSIGFLQLPALLRTMIFDNFDTLPLIVYKSLRVLSPVGYRWSLKIKQKTLVKIIQNLVNLRCLHFSTNNRIELFKIPPSIVFLWNLQSLVIELGYNAVEAPSNIWEMSQLRHINISNLYLPDPPSRSNDILKNLQSARIILNFSFSEDSVRRLPNIKEFQVAYHKKFNGNCSLNNIARLENLESFICSTYSVCSPTMRNRILSNLTLPHSLKKLFISGLKWDDVTAKIGSLPLLEVLWLSHCSGNEWKLVEGQFSCLKSLKLSGSDDLEYFTADNNHFPCLRKLELDVMSCLKEISLNVGDIPTLREIELKLCPDSAVHSAKEIAEYQYQMANEDFQVTAVVDGKRSLCAESMSTSNFRVKAY